MNDLSRNFLINYSKRKLKHFHLSQMVQPITAEDIAGVAGILQQILSNDNEQRKAAEAQLNAAKSAETAKYALLMASILDPAEASISIEAKSLAAVILRRNVSTEAMDASDLQN